MYLVNLIGPFPSGKGSAEDTVSFKGCNSTSATEKPHGLLTADGAS